MTELKPTIASPQKRDKKESRPSFRSPADILPLIKRGISGMIDEEEESIVSMGWKVEVTSRKEREETLR